MSFEREDIVSQELYAAACAGQPKALREFFDKVIPYIRGVVHHILQRARPEAISKRDDYVNDVCLALVDKNNKVNPPIERAAMKKYDPQRASIRGFLYVFSKSRIIEQLRKDTKLPVSALIPSDELADWAANTPLSNEQSGWRLALERLDKYLANTLSKRELEVLERTLKGLSVAQTAAELNTTEQNIYAITYRLRKIISNSWSTVMGEPLPRVYDKNFTKKTKAETAAEASSDQDDADPSQCSAGSTKKCPN